MVEKNYRVFQQRKDLMYHLATWDLSHEARAVCGRKLSRMQYVQYPITGHKVCANCRMVVG